MSQDKLDYFIEQTNDRFDKIDKKLDNLISWKWKMIGAAGTMVFLSGLIAKLL